MKSKYPIIGYIAVWPTQKIVKVKIEPDKNHQRYVNTWGYPYKVSSIEKGIGIANAFDNRMSDDQYEEKWMDSFNIADSSLVKLYPTQEAGEKAELEKLHDQYLNEKRALRKRQERVKFANKRIQEYKTFRKIQTPYPTS